MVEYPQQMDGVNDMPVDSACGGRTAAEVLNEAYALWRSNRDEGSEPLQRSLVAFFEYKGRCTDVDERIREQAVQVSQRKVIAKIDTFEGKSRFSTWCHRVFRNTLLDEIRKSDPEFNRAASLDAAAAADAFDEGLTLHEVLPDSRSAGGTARSAFWMDLNACREQALSPEEDHLFKRIFIQNAKQMELAESLNVSNGTVTNRKKKILEKLQNCLKTRGYDASKLHT